MEGVREDLQEMATQELQQWDTSFKLRPAPSGQPKDWSVEDLCLVLQEQGLADSVDRLVTLFIGHSVTRSLCG